MLEYLNSLESTMNAAQGGVLFCSNTVKGNFLADAGFIHVGHSSFLAEQRLLSFR